MEPVVTPAEMAAIDAAAPEPVEDLIGRAGWEVASAARRMLDDHRRRRYGARVVVVAGKGNNGADGRSAARFLARDGVRARVVDPAWPGLDPSAGHHPDLVIDAAFGTGFRGRYAPPAIGDTRVLAVDIPSGVDGLTGQVGGSALPATATVTLGALKPGLLLGPGRRLAGPVTVAPIGLDCSTARCHRVGGTDVAARWPTRAPDSHKWRHAVWVIGGGPLMRGAPSLAASGAARAGAGYVTVSIPGADSTAAGPPVPVEAVVRPVGPSWASEVAAEQGRYRALVVGPGLAVDDATGDEVRRLISATGDLGLVLDGGAIDAVATDPTPLVGRAIPAVLTPHEGELARLLGRPARVDRIAEVRALAASLGAVVLAKGPTTLAAHPDGRVLVSVAGDERLATAGTGDVLAGMVGAALAGGLEPLEAAGLAAELHGLASMTGRRAGLVAGDLPALAADWLSDAARGAGGRARSYPAWGPGSTRGGC